MGNVSGYSREAGPESGVVYVQQSLHRALVDGSLKKKRTASMTIGFRPSLAQTKATACIVPCWAAWEPANVPPPRMPWQWLWGHCRVSSVWTPPMRPPCLPICRAPSRPRWAIRSSAGATNPDRTTTQPTPGVGHGPEPTVHRWFGSGRVAKLETDAAAPGRTVVTSLLGFNLAKPLFLQSYPSVTVWQVFQVTDTGRTSTMPFTLLLGGSTWNVAYDHTSANPVMQETIGWDQTQTAPKMQVNSSTKRLLYMVVSDATTAKTTMYASNSSNILLQLNYHRASWTTANTVATIGNSYHGFWGFTGILAEILVVGSALSPSDLVSGAGVTDGRRAGAGHSGDRSAKQMEHCLMVGACAPTPPHETLRYSRFPTGSGETWKRNGAVFFSRRLSRLW